MVEQVGTVGLRGREEPQRHPHRVHRGVRHPDRQLHVGGERGLDAQRLVGPQHLRRDAAGGAPFQELVHEGHVLVGHGDEQAVVLLERTGGDPSQEGVLLDALHGRLVIVDGVPRAGMQQAVVASRRP